MGFWQACDHRDFTGGFATGLMAEDFELVVAAEVPERRSYRGREGVAEFAQRWMEAFERFSMQRQELIDAGNDRVFASYRQSAIGKGSGVPIELEYFAIYEVENGKVVPNSALSRPRQGPQSRRAAEVALATRSALVA